MALKVGSVVFSPFSRLFYLIFPAHGFPHHNVIETACQNDGVSWVVAMYFTSILSMTMSLQTNWLKNYFSLLLDIQNLSILRYTYWNQIDGANNVAFNDSAEV